MSAMASQITGISTVYSIVCPGADQRIHQQSALLAFVTGEFPAQRASNAENVSIWWRHQAQLEWRKFYVFYISGKRMPNSRCVHFGQVAISNLAKMTRILNIKGRHTAFFMMTSSNGNIFRVTGHLYGEFTGTGEFPAQRPVTRSFDISFDLCLNKRLSKQSWGRWFETLSRPL